MEYPNCGKTSMMPIDAMILVTLKCNAKCTMCDVWKEDPGDEIEAEQYLKLPSTLKNINITGGEPLLRRNIDEVLLTIHKAAPDARFVISTNGLTPSLVESQMSKLKKTGLRIGVRFSMDGVGDYHEKIRGIPNAYEKVLESIAIAKRLGYDDIGVGFTASDDNIEQLKTVYENAKKNDLQFVFCGIAHSSEVYFKKENDPITKEKLLKEISDYLSSKELLSFNPKDWFRAYYNKGIFNHAMDGTRSDPCRAAELFFWMKPNGDMYPDMILDRKIGNLKDAKNFDEIWNSEAAAAFRREVRPDQNPPNCPHPCWMTCTVVPHMRTRPTAYVPWILENKIKAHLGLL